MACPVLGADTPDHAKSFLQFAMVNWHPDDPKWRDLREQFLAAAGFAAPIVAPTDGCPVLGADSPEDSRASVGFSLDGWHDQQSGDPDWEKWVPLRDALLAIAKTT